jgi:hypothetical protein
MNGCCKDDISKGKAEAICSFDTSWEFLEAQFSKESNGTLFISFRHFNHSGLIDEVGFYNIPQTEGDIPLVYLREGGGLQPGKPTTYYDVLVDEDSVGEVYVIDSSQQLQSTLTLDCITNNRISGKFQLYFRFSELNSLPKFAAHIPDTFSLYNGKFDAVRWR